MSTRSTFPSQRIGEHVGQDGHPQGLAAQPPVERQDPLPGRARRHRLHPGRDGQERRRRRGLPGAPTTCRRRRRSSSRGTVRADARAKGGYELDRHRPRGASARRTTTRSRRRSTASTSCSIAGTCGFAPSGRRRSCEVRHEVVNAVRDFFNSDGFILCRHADLHAGRVRGHDHAVPGAVLRRHTAYLTQSGQLYNEANAMALGKVYCFGPTFRAEKSKTRRHLTEFWMVEPEMAYADLDDVIALAEGLVTSVVGARARQARRRAEAARARHVEARSGQGAVPAHHLRRGGEAPASTRASRSSTAPTSAAPTRPCCRSSSTARSASRTTRPR